jgi:hypothetical protein
MATQPIPTQTDVAIQSQTTGEVNYLQYQGNTLTGSSLFDYGLGTDFKVVTALPGVLVTQSQSTGVLDFLTLNANGSLAGTAMSTVSVAPIVGEAEDYGNALVSQDASGLNFMQFNTATGALTGSDLVAGTAGFPQAVGVGSWNAAPGPPEFLGVGTADSVVTQLGNGELDIVGFSGGFGTLALAGTDLLPQTIGSPTISAINQQVIGNENIQSTTSPSTQTLQLFGNMGGQPDALYVNTGLGDPTNQGSLVGTNLLNTSITGWNIVDAANVNIGIFPVPA